jgi:hypothetical protein
MQLNFFWRFNEDNGLKGEGVNTYTPGTAHRPPAISFKC